jgi:hypothetical protein
MFRIWASRCGVSGFGLPVPFTPPTPPTPLTPPTPPALHTAFKQRQTQPVSSN